LPTLVSSNSAKAIQTRLERQREREDQSISAVISGMRAEKISNPKRQQWIVDQAARIRPPAPPLPSPGGNLQRYFEAIRDPNQVHTDDKPADELTRQAVTLVELMATKDMIPFEFAMAAKRFRELWMDSSGSSKGVSSYGDYVAASEPSRRCPTSDQQMNAGRQFLDAFYGAFGVKRADGYWAYDHEVAQAVLPALLFDRKNITQAAIGRALTRYTGEKQSPAAGGTFIESVLRRLSLHFAYRER